MPVPELSCSCLSDCGLCLYGGKLGKRFTSYQFPYPFLATPLTPMPEVAQVGWIRQIEATSDLPFHLVPLVSKICPSDTYKVWKSGQNLRVDTTLLGFDHMTWQRGNRSFVFRGQGKAGGRWGRWGGCRQLHATPDPVLFHGCRYKCRGHGD